MAINVQDLSDLKIDKYAASGGDRWDALFIDAINRIIADLQIYAMTTVDAITTMTAEIDLNHAYYTAFSSGVDFYLQTDGEFALESKIDVESVYRKALKAANIYRRQSIPTTGRMGDIE